MFFKYFFSAFFLFFASSAVAQITGTVSGTVIDINGAPIADLVIRTLGKETTKTNKSGYFELELEANKSHVVIIQVEDKIKTYPINLKAGDRRVLGKVQMEKEIVKGPVIISENRTDDFSFLHLPDIDFQNLALQGGVTQALAYISPAVSNNELSTSYNVRGGNFDENLIYINGFEIYRPFLTRAGQQEGMSFIHSALVQNLSFSAGGFEARYNDRLSSVLDIQYRNPDTLRASLVAGLLGVETHVEQKIKRFSYLIGARYRSNGYLLNTLPAQGEYNPVFWDFQFLSSYDISDNLKLNLLGHYSYNSFNFVPRTRETTYGSFNQALNFKVFFQGQEQSVFKSLTGGTSLVYTPNKRTELTLFATHFNTNEQERFDVFGQYFLNELETDPNQENFGDSINSLGVGSFLNHSRNILKANILSVYHTGKYDLKSKERFSQDWQTKSSQSLRWGINMQKDYFNDNISEWVMIDSAGYISPNNQGGDLELRDVIKAQQQINNTRLSANASYSKQWFFKKAQHIAKMKVKGKAKGEDHTYFIDTIQNSTSRLNLTVGGRVGYSTLNEEPFFTPRFSLNYVPRMYFRKDGKTYRRNIRFRFATGMYYQPPLYRDMRGYFGALNPDVLAQKSVHVVAGTDLFFHMMKREKPFKLTAEAYYKHLWDVNPYKLSDVRLRYFANNDAVAYAYGFDVNMFGQFINGIESFFKIGLMRTREDLLNDDYYDFYNQDGQIIIPGYTFDNVVVDSVLRSPGFIPRPSDQLLNVGILFQDKMPGLEQLSLQLTLFYGSRLPYGPPGATRHTDTLRQRAYYRVDVGLSYDFFYGKTKEQRKGFWQNFADLRLSFETFNMLGINNVLNQTWIQDTQGRQFAVPNYLTQRLFNLKLLVKI